MRKLTRLYEHLMSDERFRLFVEAASRPDGTEMDRLNATCPTKLYRCEDAEYWRRKMDFWLLAMAYRLDLAAIETTLAASLALATFWRKNAFSGM